jgi:hypothetical protein
MYTSSFFIVYNNLQNLDNSTLYKFVILYLLIKTKGINFFEIALPYWGLEDKIFNVLSIEEIKIFESLSVLFLRFK